MPDYRLPRDATLVDLLRWRAEQYPDKVAFSFSYYGDDADRTQLTYRELDTRARAVGTALQRQGAEGERVLVVARPGLDFIAGFFGCLYAGAVAVPVHQKLAPRLIVVVPDARARFALATADTRANTRAAVDELAAGQNPRWLVIEEAAAGDPDGWVAPQITADDIAMIQYTSGSTRSPKGVLLSHHNLLHNVEAQRQVWDGDEDAIGVYWLPPHHDMGLVGGILQTLYLGFTTALMSPAAFIQRPMRWLESISRHRGVITAAPDFAYRRCVERSTPAERAAVDLSCLTAAMNGAEPVRASTLTAFAEAFAPAGFRLESFYPVYGLAEASLVVSGGSDFPLPRVCYADREALAAGRVVDIEPDEASAAPIVGCGQPRGGQTVVAVDPVSLRACGPDEVGEIWVAGPSVAQGYWGRPEETAQTFGWHLRDAGGGADDGTNTPARSFLRTGDLGFLRGGELLLTGRVKDLIVIDGHNYYPNDIEATVQGCHPALLSSRGAAFTIEPAGIRVVERIVEQLVIVQEVETPSASDDSVDLARLIDTAREAVIRHHGVEPYAIVLVRPRSIPTTSSGKVQRSLCRKEFTEGTLPVVAEHRAPEPAPLTPHDLQPALDLLQRAQAAALQRLDNPR